MYGGKHWGEGYVARKKDVFHMQQMEEAVDSVMTLE